MKMVPSVALKSKRVINATSAMNLRSQVLYSRLGTVSGCLHFLLWPGFLQWAQYPFFFSYLGIERACPLTRVANELGIIAQDARLTTSLIIFTVLIEEDDSWIGEGRRGCCDDSVRAF
jgi:hypothetical protein